MKRVVLQIYGEVQGVGYRAHCQRQAQHLGVTGWVRNRSDGSVEALVEGAPFAVDEMIAWCREGPSHAQVSRVLVSDAPDAPPLKSFNIRLF